MSDYAYPVSDDDNYFDYYDFDETHYDSSATLNFYHPKLITFKGFELNYKYRGEPESYYWHSIEDISFDPIANISAAIGYIGDGRTNFIEVSYGEGKFYLHSTPFAFTNYQLLTKQGLEYSNRVFSHLTSGDIYWDSFSKIPVRDTYNGEQKKGPLSFILSRPSLRWAWYLMLVMVLFYLIFRTRREQRIIPVVFENTNTSLEFIKTIALLYLQQNSHKKLAQLKMKYFLTYIRDRYFIKTQDMNNTLIERITVKSELPNKEVERIFEQYRVVEKNDSISSGLLIDFHKSIEHFYKHSK